MPPSEKSMPQLAIGNRYNNYHEPAKETLYLDEVPARVARIHFDGLDRTKDDVLKKISKDLLSATNFQDMIVKAQEVRGKLNNLNAFEGIGVTVDSNKGGEFNYDITFHVAEKRRVQGSVLTEFSAQNSGSINTGLLVPNVHGRGESVKLAYSYGRKCSAGFDALFSKPLLPWTDQNPNLQFSVFQKGFANPWNGLTEVNRGSYVGLSAKLNELITGSIYLNSNVTSLSATGVETPFRARIESGHFLKTSINTNVIFDSRNSTSLPTRGNLIKWSSELSGLLKTGNVNFFKNEVELQSNVSILAGLLVLQSTLKTGLINSLSSPSMSPKVVLSDDSGVPINERFNLGGPLSLRGYAINGVGPHDGWANLGGNIFWVFGAHVYTPLPFAAHLKNLVRGHIFFNSGSIQSIDLNKEKNLISTLSNNVRKSVGAGIVISFGSARLELNYSFPILGPAGSGQDRLDSGIQFGIGATFT